WKEKTSGALPPVEFAVGAYTIPWRVSPPTFQVMTCGAADGAVEVHKVSAAAINVNAPNCVFISLLRTTGLGLDYCFWFSGVSSDGAPVPDEPRNSIFP